MKIGLNGQHLLIEKLAGPETEMRLVELVIVELSRLPPERLEVLRSSCEKKPKGVAVVSAYQLPDPLRQRLKQALAEVAGPDLSLQFEQNSELLAGVQITIGAWVLSANLRDELKGFATLTHGA